MGVRTISLHTQHIYTGLARETKISVNIFPG